MADVEEQLGHNKTQRQRLPGPSVTVLWKAHQWPLQGGPTGASQRAQDLAGRCTPSPVPTHFSSSSHIRAKPVLFRCGLVRRPCHGGDDQKAGNTVHVNHSPCSPCWGAHMNNNMITLALPNLQMGCLQLDIFVYRTRTWEKPPQAFP